MVRNTRAVAIIGSEGLVGHHLADTFRENGVNTYCFYHKIIDVTKLESVLTILNNENLCGAAVFNCSLYYDNNNPQEMFDVNVQGTKNLAELCRINSSHLFHFSSDYVFDDSHQRDYTPYESKINIADTKNLLSMKLSIERDTATYSGTKKAAELYLYNSKTQSSIIRTSWVYGTGLYEPNKNFTSTVVKNLLNFQPIHILECGTSRPTPVSALCNNAYNLWKSKAKEPSFVQSFYSIDHCVGPDVHSRYSWAMYIAEQLERCYGIDYRSLVMYDIKRTAPGIVTTLSEGTQLTIKRADIDNDLLELFSQVKSTI